MVNVRYDDDDESLDTTLASLAGPSDPFARALSSHAGWERQVTTVFQESPGGAVVVRFPEETSVAEEEDRLSPDSPINVALIGEGLARLHLTDARGDGVTCGVLSRAVEGLKTAVQTAQQRVIAQKGLSLTATKALRNERASGFFLPVWTLMDQGLDMDAHALDILGMSRNYLWTSGMQLMQSLGVKITAPREERGKPDAQYLMEKLSEATIRDGDQNIVSLLNLVSSNIGLHLVHEGTTNSAMFGRMNPWLHRTLLRNFDRYRVAFTQRIVMMKQPSSRGKHGLDVFELIDVRRVLVRIPVSEGGDPTRPLINSAWTRPSPQGEPATLQHPQSSKKGTLDVVMDGIEITIKQHNYAGKPERGSKKQRFRTGGHAAFQLRWAQRKVLPGTEDARGNTLSFVYAWPDMVQIQQQRGAAATPLEVDRVKIVLYGSGQVEWWKDYYRPAGLVSTAAAAAAAGTKKTVMPYPSRRQYVARGDTVKEHLRVKGDRTQQTPVKTWIEYHDIMQLVFAQSMYGHLGELSETVNRVQDLFSTFVSGATTQTMIMGVVEAREKLLERHLSTNIITGGEIPFQRLDADTGRVLTSQEQKVVRKVIRKFPQMRDVLMATTVTPVWTRDRRRGRVPKHTRAGLPEMSLPSKDLVSVRKTDLGDLEEIQPQLQIASKIRSVSDVFAIEREMSWVKAGVHGMQNMMAEIASSTVQEMAQGMSIYAERRETSLEEVDMASLFEALSSVPSAPEQPPGSPAIPSEGSATGYSSNIPMDEQGIFEQLFQGRIESMAMQSPGSVDDALTMLQDIEASDLPDEVLDQMNAVSGLGSQRLHNQATERDERRAEED